MNTAREILQHLDTIPIETLELGEHTITILKWYGLTTVGDCIVFYIENAPIVLDLYHKLSLLMYGEVETQMKAHDYWPHVMDADMWFVMRDNWRKRIFRPRKMVTKWRGQEQDLCQIPIETLNLSDIVLDGLQHFSLKTVGQWINEYDYLYMTKDLYGESYFVQDDVYNMMLGEIILRMREEDSWPFIADNFRRGPFDESENQ